MRAEEAGQKGREQRFYCAYSLWLQPESGVIEVVVAGHLDVHGGSVKGLLGSKSDLYCGVLGLRALQWSSCVISV